ncbi:MAG: DUF6090 family protein [Saprospiraceae bacterium]|nr:hypothetical protein [Lewinella sp.]
MIKFFRKIRQNLLTKNKFSKYLLYAIGEIALIMIGILMALQVNNWNELRKLRAQEVKYIKSIKSDLTDELKDNNEMIAYRSAKAKAASRLLTYTRPETVEEFRTYADTVGLVYIWGSFTPKDNTYKELISSGNLNLISDDSLRYYLLELDKMHVGIANLEHHMRREYEQYLYDATWPNTNFGLFADFEGLANTGSLESKEDTWVTDPDLAAMASDFEWTQNNLTIKNGLKLAAMNNLVLAENHTIMRKLLEKMIAISNRDL